MQVFNLTQSELYNLTDKYVQVPVLTVDQVKCQEKLEFDTPAIVSL
jgi:hypothetical protein